MKIAKWLALGVAVTVVGAVVVIAADSRGWLNFARPAPAAGGAQ